MNQNQEQINENIVEISTKKNKVKLKKEKIYFVWKDTSFIWTIIVLLLCFLITISFLNARWLTTIHSYTVNIFFGMFSILFYIWVLLFCFKKLFSLKNTYSIKIFHFSMWRLALFFLAITIFGSVIYFTAHKIFPVTGKSFKETYDYWFKTFSSSNDAILPYKWNAGIVGSFFYAFFTLLGKTTGIVVSFALSFIILVCSILIFFISDVRFNLISFSKTKRDVARKTLFNKKNTNLKIQPSFNIQKESKIIAKEQDEELPIKNINLATIKNKLEQTKEEKPTPNIIAEQITKNALKESQDSIKEIPSILNSNKKYKTVIMDNGIAQIVTDEQNLDAIETKTIKIEEIAPKTVDFDDNPFYTSTIEIPSLEKTEEMGVLEKTAEKNLEKTSEEYISKFVNEKEFKKFEKEITKTTTLEVQQINLEKQEKTRTIEINNPISKAENTNETNDNSKKRYAIIEDAEEMF